MRTRTAVVVASLAGLGAVVGYGIADLRRFGAYDGAYGLVLNDVVRVVDNVNNIVSGVAYDVRSWDTVGEIFILFAALMGTALLLRERRDEGDERPSDEATADTIRLLGLVMVPILVAIGLWVSTTAALSAGGGFQVGVVLAGALLLLWAAGSYRAYRKASPAPMVDFGEGVGAGGAIVIGLWPLLHGAVFLELFPHPGPFPPTIASGGSILFLNWAAALEVAAANVLIFHEFLEEYEPALPAARR